MHVEFRSLKAYFTRYLFNFVLLLTTIVHIKEFADGSWQEYRISLLRRWS